MCSCHNQLAQVDLLSIDVVKYTAGIEEDYWNHNATELYCMSELLSCCV